MLATNQNEFSILRQKAGLSIAQTADELQLSEKTIYRYENGETTPRVTDIRALVGFACAQNSRLTKTQVKAFTFIDLFAGIGGLRKGFEHIGGQCVFTSEWDKYSQQTYRANFQDDHEIAGDITKIDASEIPNHDVLIAGFPCQPFSIAGVSKKNALNRPHGFACDTQGTLFFDVARIIDHHKPAAFVLENVKNLVSHDKGRTFKTICKVLENELGYHIDYKVINAKSWVPQNRARIFIVGFKKDVGFNFGNMEIPDPLNGPKLSSILLRKGSNELSEKYTLSDKLWNYLQNYAAKHKAKGNGFGFGLVSPNDVARTLSARYYKDGSEILVAQKNANPRRLTPRECARLMGFDESDQEEFKIPVSDTQSYKQFGNSVAVPAVKAVAEFLEPFIDQSITQLAGERV